MLVASTEGFVSRVTVPTTSAAAPATLRGKEGTRSPCADTVKLVGDSRVSATEVLVWIIEFADVLAEWTVGLGLGLVGHSRGVGKGVEGVGLACCY